MKEPSEFFTIQSKKMMIGFSGIGVIVIVGAIETVTVGTAEGEGIGDRVGTKTDDVGDINNVGIGVADKVGVEVTVGVCVFVKEPEGVELIVASGVKVPVDDGVNELPPPPQPAKIIRLTIIINEIEKNRSLFILNSPLTKHIGIK